MAETFAIQTEYLLVGHNHIKKQLFYGYLNAADANAIHYHSILLFKHCRIVKHNALKT